MKSVNCKTRYGLAAALLLFSMFSIALAGEKIIQEEKMSFDKCLSVITTSENKLAISPEIFYISDQKRAAEFKLVDGTLTITCDGIKGFVTVSTNTY